MEEYDGRQSIHILLVEDNPGDARLIEEGLATKSKTLEVRLTVHGTLATCLDEAERRMPDVLLLDLGLPDSQGLETFHSVRRIFPEVPVVVLSGDLDESIAVSAVQEGAEDFLPKGEVTPSLLCRSIRHAIERHKLKAKVQYLATHDPLTGVYNRRYFNRAIEDELARSLRYQHPIGFLMVDVNGFKEINDRLGHQVGDDVLCQVAAYLSEQLRTVDMVIRYGGDEFLLVLPETDGGARDVAERIQCDVAGALATRLPTLDVPITLAVGASHWEPAQGRSIEEALAEADERMYESKRAAAEE